jgi:hypothetical protein
MRNREENLVVFFRYYVGFSSFFWALYELEFLDLGFLHFINGINYREFLWCPNWRERSGERSPMGLIGALTGGKEEEKGHQWVV